MMADVDAYGQLVMTNGQVIPLFRADLAEAAEEEIFTDTNFVGSAQNAGTIHDIDRRREVCSVIPTHSESMSNGSALQRFADAKSC